jgi:ABC-2 type transport system permease protein
VLAQDAAIEAPVVGYVALLPALVLRGLMLGALGMLLSSTSKQLENFAGAMKFVIFPMFLRPRPSTRYDALREGSPWLYYLWEINPFTHAVELVRFAPTGRSTDVVGGGRRCTALFMVGAILAYETARTPPRDLRRS